MKAMQQSNRALQSPPRFTSQQADPRHYTPDGVLLPLHGPEEEERRGCIGNIYGDDVNE